jgi:hypothetical protein
MMTASAHESERAIHGVNFHRGFEPLHGENPEAILATAAHGVFMELAWALLALEQPERERLSRHEH